MSKNLLVILGVVILLLAGGGYYLWSLNQPDADPTSASNLPPDKVQPDDHVMGNANAPVTMIEYFAQDCSVCARFNQDVFPQLKAKYIDTGKVRYVMRLYPLSPLDGTSYKLDMCMPPDRFFQTADLLFRNQAQWDSFEFAGVDAHAGLIRMARILGLTADQAEACMNSTKLDASINKVQQEGTTRYHPQGTPTFVIDYQNVDFPQKSWENAQAAIDAALKAKGAK